MNEPMRPVLTTPYHPVDLFAYQCALGAAMIPYEISHSVPTDEWSLNVPCDLYGRADSIVGHVMRTARLGADE